MTATFFALSVGQAKTIAVLAVVVLVGGALFSAWVMKEIMQKVALFTIFGLLALLFWTQRASLSDCSNRVTEQARTSVSQVDTTCSFLGQDIKISTVRSTDE